MKDTIAYVAYEFKQDDNLDVVYSKVSSVGDVRGSQTTGAKGLYFYIEKNPPFNKKGYTFWEFDAKSTVDQRSKKVLSVEEFIACYVAEHILGR